MSHTLDRIIGHAEALRTQIGAALAHIDRQLRQTDSLPGGGDDVKVRATAELTAVERAAERRLKLTQQRDYLHGLLDASELGLKQARHEVALILGTRIDGPARCDGRGLEGFDEWGEACERPADKAGLCSKHYMRCYRWRTDHGLRPLRDEAA